MHTTNITNPRQLKQMKEFWGIFLLIANREMNGVIIKMRARYLPPVHLP